MRYILFICLSIGGFSQSGAQTDPEFPKEFVVHARLHNGMITNLTNASDVYVGGLQLVSQYTLIQSRMRGGLIGDLYYTGKKIQAAIGPTISFKLVTFKAKPFGSLGNLHLSLDHLWGTNHERLLGGGLNADIGNKFVLGLSVHRDYHFNTWWLQNTLAFRISKTKKLPQL